VPFGQERDIMETFINFYPTPDSLLSKIIKPSDLGGEILEPSAGKGNIVKYIQDTYNKNHIDCIEINTELSACLDGQGFRVVYNDFLNFKTYKHYDSIIMNPPFDAGAAHLLKAISMQENGGKIICILNAETIRNPYTNDRKNLRHTLQKYNAEIQYMTHEFSSSERSTDVDIAVIRLNIPQKPVGSSFIYAEMKRAKELEPRPIEEMTALVENDFISSAVKAYEIEMEAGLSLIKEFRALAPNLMASLQHSEYEKSILSLRVNDHDFSYINAENTFVEAIRKKYWEGIFGDHRFTKTMPSDMLSSYREKIAELTKYEFNYHNIKDLQIQMSKNLVSGIEKSIMDLFDELSQRYSYHEESSNIHYYNGWCSNKAWYVNSKVILPFNAFSYIWKKMDVSDYHIVEKIGDIELALNYLAGCPGATIDIGRILRTAHQEDQEKNIECKYFKLTFHKKGTCHLVFKDEELLKKLNIFGGRGKNMLPPSYGKKHYADMSKEEQVVIDAFDTGESGYEKICSEAEKYLYLEQNNLFLIA